MPTQVRWTAAAPCFRVSSDSRDAPPRLTGGTMSTAMMARPAADEPSAYYHRYIARGSDEGLAQQLIEQAREVERLFQTVADRDALARYAEGKWRVKEILGHLCDTERVFSY